MAAEIAQRRITGAAVSVARGGTILWQAGYGLADVASGRPSTAHTPFGLASVTKPVTTAAVALLAAAGRIDLDAPIARYLPFALPRSDHDAEAVTARRLGAHAAGLPSFFRFAARPGQPPETAALIRDYGRLAFAPGTLYEYSNLGFALLGAAIVRVTGWRYEEAVRRLVLAPMRLRDAVFLAEPAARTRAATRYADDGTPLAFATTATPASGELCASAHDLALFAAQVMGVDARAALPAAARAALLAPVLRSGGDYTSFGWMGTSVGGERVLVKNGGDPGAATRLTLLPDRGVSIAVLTNRVNDAFVAEVSDRIAALLVPGWSGVSEQLAPPRRAARPAAAIHGDWRGTLGNAGIARPFALRLAPDHAACRLGDAAWRRCDEAAIRDGIVTAICPGGLDGAAAGTRLDLRLVAAGARLGGRVLVRDPRATTPYVVTLDRASGGGQAAAVA
ncbi:serine hydrolase [Sphingomonas sp. BK235]|uniref:serine hydrolase domain-containing protein n=1 Tax=Sphingomonas sp. BK235 TaxID=2512131 RepID=UPI00244216E0|nr:serine hydrolase [Sphingomonas sp. BK235]